MKPKIAKIMQNQSKKETSADNNKLQGGNKNESSKRIKKSIRIREC